MNAVLRQSIEILSFLFRRSILKYGKVHHMDFGVVSCGHHNVQRRVAVRKPRGTFVDGEVGRGVGMRNSPGRHNVVP